MSRDPRSAELWLLDIVTGTDKVQRFTKDISREQFEADELINDAVLRNLEVIGEAAAKLPPEVTSAAPNVAWQKIRAFRNYLAHAYFGLDNDVV